jgi:phage minor structural protein
MILFFADRRLNIIGRASTELPEGLIIENDNQLDDVETGFTVFECEIPFDENTLSLVERCTAVGNYILRSNDGKNEFLTIVEREKDTKAKNVYIYAEDAGLDLFNEICVPYAADKAYTIDHYINKFAYDSGFVIGINEVPNLTRKLSWDGESTATARIASVATQFDNCEVSYSFKVDGFRVTAKYINIHKKRGKDIGIELRLNRDVDRIVTKESITNLATALKVTGGTPEDADNPINLSGYKYDDGDMFLEGTYLKSRKAVAIWSRYLAESGNYTGHIMRTFTYDTTSQAELCSRAVAELKRVSQIEVNYEVELSRLPKDVRIGDRVNIVDDAGELYMSARILKLERSEANKTNKATLGEYLIKSSGISQKVSQLAEQFSKASQNSIASTVEQFYQSNSATELYGGSWSNTQPTWVDGKFIWRRTRVTYGNGTIIYTPDMTGVCITGNTGAPGAAGAPGEAGPQGEKGETGAAGKDGQMLYATCATAAGTKNKVATLSSGSLSLKAGDTVAVKFTYANSISSPTLNVDGSGAATIRLNGSALTNSAYYWGAGSVVTFVYDGTYWNVADAAALTKSAEAAKTASDFISYDATNGLLVGNKKSGAFSGYRAQVKSDSFNILDANGNALASYGANDVDLGKNNQDTKIKFCNGKAQIRYDASEGGYTVLEGLAQRIHGDKTAALIASSDVANSDGGYTQAHLYAVSGDADSNPYLWLKSVADYPDIDAIKSEIFVRPSEVDIHGMESIRLVAQAVAVEAGLGVAGDMIVNGHAQFENGVTIAGDTTTTGDYYDRFGTRINNGLAVYASGGTEDPNTTKNELILTGTNTPKSGVFYYVKTFFYTSKTNNRAQLAIPYTNGNGVYHRVYKNGSWGAWVRLLDDATDHNHGNTTAGFFSITDGWIGMYDSASAAASGTGYKGWFGYDTGDKFVISDQDNGVDIKSSTGNIRFFPAGTTARTAMLSDRFRPMTNDQQYLGDSTYKWKAVYAVNGTIQTSDRNQKTNIAEIDQKYIDLFDRLLPVSFEFSDAESDRTHIGFVSQDVEAAMAEVGLTDLDFAGFCKDAAMEMLEEIDTNSPVLDDAGEPVLDENGVPTYHTKEVEKPVLDEAGNPVYIYSLRYSEFIALNSRMIQLNRERIAQQQTEIESLKADMYELQKVVRALTAQSGIEVVSDG